MKTLKVKANSAKVRSIIYVGLFQEQPQFKTGGTFKETEGWYCPENIAKVIVYSDACFSSVKAMNNHYERLALEEVIKQGLIKEIGGKGSNRWAKV